jgi:hypothetical protein
MYTYGAQCVYMYTYGSQCVYMYPYGSQCVYMYTYGSQCVYMYTYRSQCVYMYTYRSQYRDAGLAKQSKIGTAVKVVCHFGHKCHGFMQRDTLFRGKEYRIEPGLTRRRQKDEQNSSERALQSVSTTLY